MKVGILGGGQLARMMILDGLRLGLTFRVFDKKLHASTKDIVTCHTGSFSDEEALKKFADGLDVITSEFENVPSLTIELLSKYVPCFPKASAFGAAQDRLVEKTMIRELNIPTTEFLAIDKEEDLHKAANALGFPFIIKTRQLGYDGKGQKVVASESEVEGAWKAIDKSPAIAEAFVDFQRELSIIGVFGRNGEVSHYPLVENDHDGGILVRSFAPAKTNSDLDQQALTIVNAIAKHYNYVGVLVVELFQTEDKLLVNEIAPRVHNSGHWTIEGAICSQFENHVRAVCGLPLGSTEERFHSLSYNILGTLPRLEAVLDQPGAHLHLYNKSEATLRKLGHITYCNQQQQEPEAFIETIESLRKTE